MTKKDDAVVEEEVKQETPVEEPTPQEEEQPAVEENLEEDEQTLDELIGEETEEAKPKETEAKPEEPPKRGAEARKQQLETEIQAEKEKLGIDPNTEIRDLVAAKNALRDLNEARRTETQLATEQELLNEVNPDTGDYYTPQEAERIARQQSLEQAQQNVAQERYQLEVQQNQATIRNEAIQALSDFPMFDEKNKEAYNPELASKADALLEQSLIFDDNGVLVGSTLSPYQIYKTIADSADVANPQRQAQAQKATEQMLANVDESGGASQASSQKEDPLLAGFDEEAGRL